MMIECTGCNTLQPLSNYNIHSNGKLRKHCKNCERNRHYKRTYGITVDDYNRMFEEQQGVCKICSLPANHNSNHLCIDHDHDTGQVRALLCDTCNRGLGYFKDDSRLIEKAAEYLRTFKG